MSTIMGVSWVAVIVGAVLAFILGWLWYSQFLFGKRWAEGVGVELADASSMPMGAMVTNAIGLLGLAWVAALIAGNIWLWGLVILAFAILGYSGGLFRKNSSGAAWVDAGYLIANGVLLWIVNLWL